LIRNIFGEEVLEVLYIVGDIKLNEENVYNKIDKDSVIIYFQKYIKEKGTSITGYSNVFCAHEDDRQYPILMNCKLGDRIEIILGDIGIIRIKNLDSSMEYTNDYYLDFFNNSEIQPNNFSYELVPELTNLLLIIAKWKSYY